jgi:hypothetical protein
LTVDKSGTVHATLWAIRDGTAGVTYLRRRDSKWTLSSPGIVSLSPAAALTASGDSVLLSLVDDSPASTDSARLTVASSSNSGLSWTIVGSTLLNGRLVIHPEFVRRDGKTLLIWGEKRQGRATLDTVRIAEVRQEGLRPVVAFGVPVGATSFSLATSDCGETVILVGALGSSSRIMEYSSGPLHTMEIRGPIAGDDQSAFATVINRANNFVALLAVIAPGGPPRSVIATRRSC